MRAELEKILAAAFQTPGPLDRQTRHRIDLVDFWRPAEGARILEVGCGPGDTTAVLAAAVGEHGRVLGVEKNPGRTVWGLSGLPLTLTQADMPLSPAVEEFLSAQVYGDSPALGTPMPKLLASPLGGRVTLRMGLDLLDPDVDFPPDSFDLVVFSHSSWYLEQPDMLRALFARTRPWAKALAYAEWNLIPECFEQLPHLLAALLQLNVLALYPGARRRNVVSLILPEQARRMAGETGWRIGSQRGFDTAGLQDAVWEGRVAHELAEFRERMDPYARGVVDGQRQLLLSVEQALGGASSKDPQARAGLIRQGCFKSLSTHAFLAERDADL